jgi:hypothetical protein
MKSQMEEDGKEKRVRGIDTQRGETVLLVARPAIGAVWPKYVLTLGLYGLWRRQNTTVLTDRRVLVGKGIFSRREQTLPITRINDATYVRRGLFAYCEIASTYRGRSHVLRIGPFSSRKARQFTDEILSRS